MYKLVSYTVGESHAGTVIKDFFPFLYRILLQFEIIKSQFIVSNEQNSAFHKVIKNSMFLNF